MGNKSFEAGMQAGAKPFEEKLQKQANAFDKTADRLDGKLDDIRVVTDTLVDDGLARERKEVFGLNTLFDINSMEDTEKILVVSLLYTLAQRFEANDYQKNYIRSVQKYLELKNIQPADTLTGVEGVKNFDDQKAILQVVMEYLFLECFSFDFLDEDDYEEMFDSFNINRKGFREVETAIENIYQAVGAEGLAEKYGIADDDNIDNESTEKSTISKEELEKLEQEAEKLYLEFKIAEALEIFNQLVELKYARATYFASEIYVNGFGIIPPNKDKAVALRKLGCEQGYYLCMLNSTFIDTNSIKSVLPTLIDAAQQGDIFAQYELASVYDQGNLVEKNTDTALMWLNRSCDYWRSKFALGYYYYTGKSVVKDEQQAYRYWGEIAELGYLEAGHNFLCIVSASLKELNTSSDANTKAMCYLNKAVDAKLTFSLYRKAEKLYNAPFYTKEQKIEFQTEAKELLRQAAEQGYEDAVKKFNRLQSGKKISLFSWHYPYYAWYETVEKF